MKTAKSVDWEQGTTLPDGWKIRITELEWRLMREQYSWKDVVDQLSSWWMEDEDQFWRMGMWQGSSRRLEGQDNWVNEWSWARLSLKVNTGKWAQQWGSSWRLDWRTVRSEGWSWAILDPKENKKCREMDSGRLWPSTVDQDSEEESGNDGESDS